MSTQNTITKYTFLPWVKTGLGASISNNEKELEGPRATIKVDLSVRRFNESNIQFEPLDLISKHFLLYGPGDIAGIMNNVIIRVEPRPNTLNVEPNYFPFIEFSQADFPWRYTPAMPRGDQPSGRLSPWISLIVLKPDEFFAQPATEPDLLPKIVIRNPVDSLPDLEQCWGWAHTQITQEVSNQESLRQILASEPHKVISRVLSLRKLEANSRYFAFLVPTFEAGRLAGLGLPVDVAIKGTSFAWRIRGSAPDISPMNYEIPVYYQWEFSTSPKGEDFESLASRLEQRDDIPKEVGLQRLDVSEAFLSAGKKIDFKKPLFFGGALLSHLAKEFLNSKKVDLDRYLIEGPDTEEGEEGEGGEEEENPSPEEVKAFIMQMKELVDLGERLSWSFVEKPDFSNDCKDPIISPPMYGKWHAGKRLVSKISEDFKDPWWVDSLNLNDAQKNLLKEIKDDPYKWLQQLNLDPTNRVAAGLGAEVIKVLQEELMTSAWDQAGPLRESNKRLSSLQLARELSSNVFDRFVQPLEPGALIRMVKPFHTRVEMMIGNDSKSVWSLLHNSPIPDAILTPTFTKIAEKQRRMERSRRFNVEPSISFLLLDRLNKKASHTDIRDPNIVPSTPKGLLTIDYVVDSPILDLMNKSITEEGFRGNELDQYLRNGDKREMVKSIENSIPDPDAASTLEESGGVAAPLEQIGGLLKESLDPLLTIKTKIHQEVKRPKRLNEEKKDEGDPVIAYPEFKRPMFEPLRDLWEDLVFPGIKHIPQNSIGILEANPIFINSYMVGLNHEMAKELLWREYRTDQRGSYFRQFWDASAAVEREKLEHFQKTGHLPSPDQDKEIIEKYLDIPEIHRWKDSSLEGVQEEIVHPPPAATVLQADRQVLLIRGELLMRFPNAVIYAVKAKSDNTNNKKPVLPTPEEEFRLVLQEDIKEPVFRGSIPPDITFLGFDIPLEDLLGNDVNADPGYFFIIQEQPSEPRFGIDVLVDSTVDPASLESWNDLDWNYFTPALGSLGSNNYIDLENALLKGKKIGKVTWGNHAADLAYILMQQPVRIAVHARELLKNLRNGEQ